MREQREAGRRAARDRARGAGGEKDLPSEGKGLRAEDRRGDVCEATFPETNAGSF